MFSKKATQIDEIFTVNLTVTTYCQIDSEDFVNFCGLLRKHELYQNKVEYFPNSWGLLRIFELYCPRRLFVIIARLTMIFFSSFATILSYFHTLKLHCDSIPMTLSMPMTIFDRA